MSKTKKVVDAEELANDVVDADGKEVTMIELELDLDNDIVKALIEYASSNIVNDDQALINWAVNDILKKVVEEKEKENGEES